LTQISTSVGSCLDIEEMIRFEDPKIMYLVLSIFSDSLFALNQISSLNNSVFIFLIKSLSTLLTVIRWCHLQIGKF